jgi:hypothetical protein
MFMFYLPTKLFQQKTDFLYVVFWLIGANAPIMKIHFKCIFKK